MSTVEVRVPDIGDFKDVAIIELHVTPGSEVKAEDPLITLDPTKRQWKSRHPRAAGSKRSMSRSATR
jgi:multidrug resistance efflux pump